MASRPVERATRPLFTSRRVSGAATTRTFERDHGDRRIEADSE
jgi:hypothetical protein